MHIIKITLGFNIKLNIRKNCLVTTTHDSCNFFFFFPVWENSFWEKKKFLSAGYSDIISKYQWSNFVEYYSAEHFKDSFELFFPVTLLQFGGLWEIKPVHGCFISQFFIIAELDSKEVK